MTEPVVFMDCDNCGEVIPSGATVHTAYKRRYEYSGIYDEPVHLCCACYRYVGGTCDH